MKVLLLFFFIRLSKGRLGTCGRDRSTVGSSSTPYQSSRGIFKYIKIQIAINRRGRGGGRGGRRNHPSLSISFRILIQAWSMRDDEAWRLARRKTT